MPSSMCSFYLSPSLNFLLWKNFQGTKCTSNFAMQLLPPTAQLASVIQLCAQLVETSFLFFPESEIF